MPTDRLLETLRASIDQLEAQGTAKGAEDVVVAVVPAQGDRGPRFHLEGHGERSFLRMSSNSYLGMSLVRSVIEAEHEVAGELGAGPGAVRFISGTYRQHVELEERLAAFHGRESAMIFSSAYATIMGTLVPLITPETVVLSDELNHNCIINAMRLARGAGKKIYPHLDLDALDRLLGESAGEGRRAVVVTDGVFSMRGDHAPLDEIAEICRRHDDAFPENVVLLVDDSHGVGAFGETGRGTEEVTAGKADLLVGTLGKAFGVNGGYVAGPRTVTAYLRETSPFYIYSNPITQAEAAAARAAVDVVDSARGRELLAHLREMTKKFERGLTDLGFETIPAPHPVVPLMVRDTAKTRSLVSHLRHNGVLATGLAYPVVPRGDEEIRFQISADHTEADIDQVLSVLESFPGR